MLPFVMVMLSLSHRDLNYVFDGFMDSVVPKLRIGKKKFRDKLLNHEFTDLQEYMQQTLMLNNTTLDNYKNDFLKNKTLKQETKK